MRINLSTTYPERNEAKALGARWDGARQVWYIEDVEDLTPFLRWIPNIAKWGMNILASPLAAPAKTHYFQPRTTGAAEVTHCGCNVLPWEDCMHTTSTISLL